MEKNTSKAQQTKQTIEFVKFVGCFSCFVKQKNKPNRRIPLLRFSARLRPTPHQPWLRWQGIQGDLKQPGGATGKGKGSLAKDVEVLLFLKKKQETPYRFALFVIDFDVFLF